MRLDDLVKKLKENICVPLLVYGLCDTVQTSNNGEFENRLRDVSDVERYEPIVYTGDTIICPIINGIFEGSTISSYKTPIRLICVTDEYGVFDEIVGCFDIYSIKVFTANRDSQNIYYEYFPRDENKVFDRFAFTIDIDLELSKQIKTEKRIC